MQKKTKTKKKIIKSQQHQETLGKVNCHYVLDNNPYHNHHEGHKNSGSTPRCIFAAHGTSTDITYKIRYKLLDTVVNICG